MALKGTTRIELTNVKTGEREVIEKDNLVTNAVEDVLSLNPDGWMYKQGSMRAYDTFLPICPNLIGGILLYESVLDENPQKYFAHGNNRLIGYSSNNVNDGADVKRGSMNQIESGMLEDGSGYRFVFDFATSQANGTISALGLTSKWGGESGYGSALSGGKVVQLLDYLSAELGSAANYMDTAAAKYAHIVSVDALNNIGYYAHVSGQGLISLGKVTVDLNTIGLAKNIGPNKLNVLETTIITTERFCARAASSTAYYAVCDDEEYIWLFEHRGGATGNSSGNATIDFVKISKADWSFEEGTFVLNAQLYSLGRNLAAPGSSANYTSANYAIIKDGFLYCLRYDRTAVVKIDLSNPTNITVIDNPKGVIPIVRSYDYDNYYGAVEFNVVGNVIYFPGGYIEGDIICPVYVSGIDSYREDIYSNNVSPRGLKGGCAPGIHYGPFMLMYDRQGSSVRRQVYLMTPYLATINNLEKPVEKTADKTMKITYIIREE